VLHRCFDIVRYADAANEAKHYVNVIFENDDKKIEVFSRSGHGGRYERIEATKLQNALYGTIKGVGSDKTGYYSRSVKRK
jgi:hypothetical protein